MLSQEGWSTGEMYRRKRRRAPLHLHNVEQHNGNTPGFWMKVTEVFGGDATKWQVRKAVVIQQTPGRELMNRRDEWRHVTLPHMELCVTWALCSRQPICMACICGPSIYMCLQFIFCKKIKWPTEQKSKMHLSSGNTWQSNEERPSSKLTTNMLGDCKKKYVEWGKPFNMRSTCIAFLNLLFYFFQFSIFSVILIFHFLLFSFFQGCESIYQENQYTNLKLETNGIYYMS